MKTLIRIAAVCAVGVLAAGCSTGASDKGAHIVSNSAVVAPFAAPTGPSVLEVTRADSEVVNVDYESLDHLAAKTYDLYEPFEKKNISFKGVELWTVLQSAGVPASATTVHLTALDDYAVDLSVADLKTGGVIVATQTDGQPIAIDHGGPIRLVFADGVKAGSNPDQWIWSIAKIAVQ